MKLISSDPQPSKTAKYEEAGTANKISLSDEKTLPPGHHHCIPVSVWGYSGHRAIEALLQVNKLIVESHPATRKLLERWGVTGYEEGVV